MKDTDQKIRIVGFSAMPPKKSILFMTLAVIFGVAMLFISFFLILIAIYAAAILMACGYFDKYNIGLDKNSQSYLDLQKKRKKILLIMVGMPILILFATILF